MVAKVSNSQAFVPDLFRGILMAGVDVVVSIITYFYNYFIRILNVFLQQGGSLSPTLLTMLEGYILSQSYLLFVRGSGLEMAVLNCCG